MKRGKWLGIDINGVGLCVVSYSINNAAYRNNDVTLTSGRAEYKVPGPQYFRTLLIKVAITNNVALTFLGMTLVMHRKRSVVGART